MKLEELIIMYDKIILANNQRIEECKILIEKSKKQIQKKGKC